MIILTSKRLNALREEIKADLRGEVMQQATDMIIQAFQSMSVNTDEISSTLRQTTEGDLDSE